jgi:hypothetical protein
MARPYAACEKLEVIRLVEESALPVWRTLEKIGIARATFYRWYQPPCGSGHPKITHHSALLMFDDVTVQHPVAGIVGDKGNLDLLLRQKKHGVRVMHRQVLPAAVDDLERMAVNMDRMQEWRCVLQRE